MQNRVGLAGHTDVLGLLAKASFHSLRVLGSEAISVLILQRGQKANKKTLALLLDLEFQQSTILASHPSHYPPAYYPLPFYPGEETGASSA